MKLMVTIGVLNELKVVKHHTCERVRVASLENISMLLYQVKTRVEM